MRAIVEMPLEDAGRIHTLFADIDDTLTTDGRLLKPAPIRRWSDFWTRKHCCSSHHRPTRWLVRYDCADVARFRRCR